MKVLVVGSGGREHALAWKLAQSSQVEQIICAPGNGGTSTVPRTVNVDIGVSDFSALLSVAQAEQIDLVVVGPEVPLAQGITDFFQAAGMAVFGPDQAGAQLEASKAWAKELMAAAGVPTAQSAAFTDAVAAEAYVQQQGAPIVVKADGLAAGKGVIVAQSVSDALSAIADLFQQGFETLVIEEFLVGEEASVLALTDGTVVRSLLPAQDHKRIGESDTGPNTGGMGAYAPAPVVTPELRRKVDTDVLEPIVKALRARGIDYRGVLYAGLMIDPHGDLKVLEFNCRFGDPETQVVLPLLATPLIDLLLACVEQRLETQPPIAWHSGSAACVVATSPGYPGSYPKGLKITGLDVLDNSELTVFHAGTQTTPELVTSGGRVLNVTAVGADLPTALETVYEALPQIHFEGMYFRRDIGQRAIKQFKKQPLT
ncbi:MAG: phosphoribosylamine--glycine ligase [Cyanobacteria bacterium P01_H01_bin.15]